MEKINFQQPKNQFQRAEIGFLLKGWLLQNFRIFNRALNKTILFLLARKFVSTSRNEEFVKKTVSLGRNCFHCLEYLINGKNGFSLARKTVSSFSVKMVFHIISVMVTTSKKNTIKLKNTISLRQKTEKTILLD